MSSIQWLTSVCHAFDSVGGSREEDLATKVKSDDTRYAKQLRQSFLLSDYDRHGPCP